MQAVTWVQELLEPVFSKTDEQFYQVTPLKKLAEVCKLRLAYFVILFFVVAIIGEATGLLSQVFVAIFGFVYPAYMTFRALTSEDSEECKEWLTYWIVFGFFTVFAGLLKSTLFFFLSRRTYNVFRLFFFLYLFHPATKGAALIYNQLLRRKLTEALAQIESHNDPKSHLKAKHI